MVGVLRQIAFKERGLASDDRAAANEDVFAALVSRQSAFVFRVAYSVLRNASDAEDVVQETFLKIYRSGRWKDIRDEKAFLARAAWRLAIGCARTAQRETSHVDIRCGHDNPEQTAMSADWDATVHRLVEALPKELRLPLALSVLDELTSREIGTIMGIPEGTVRRRLMRARQILKQKLSSLQGGACAK